ncbi:tripartite motif-containing protein 45-like [Mytilus californianus]|uniref:tripartite motif-containing protein 45-like n=1 Tax=Mytilus californianus TaxID=6549 RepID=UPI002247D18E|nr:tripartite motif-containing protein 45-like [Mytilus californianus]
MTQSEKFCKPCSRSGRSSVAVKHCHDCAETLCSDCFQAHDTFKPLLTHHVTVLGDTWVHASLRSKLCTEHPGSKVEYYCNSHACLCCKSCIGVGHNSCSKVKPIDIASKGVKKSAEFNDFVKSIGIMRKTVSQLKEKTHQNKEDLCDNKAKIKKRIRKYKSNVLKHIDNIETELIAEVDSVFSSIISKAENEVNIIDQQTEHVNEMCNQYEFLEKNGTESDLFVVLNSNSKSIAKSLEDLKVALKSREQTEVSFQKSNLLSVINSLGTITVDTINEDGCYTNESGFATDTVRKRRQNYMPTRFKLDKTFMVSDNNDDIEVTGIGVTRNDSLILCNKHSAKLMIYSSKIKYLCELPLAGKPWDITVVPDSDEAWVTIPESSCIQHVDADSSNVDPPIKVPKCYGITLVEDNIALGRWGEVVIVNKDGIRVKQLEFGKGIIHSLSSGINGTIYCCEGEDGMFRCIRLLDGKVMFTYNSENFRWPVNMATDVQDNIYLLGMKSHNLHRLLPKGTFHKEMLTESDELNFPRCIAFNKNYSKLYISNDLGKSISVFSCKYI